MEEVGVNYVNISVGENKEVASPYQEPTEEEKEILQNKAELIGDEFLNDVVEARNLTQSQRQEVGTAEVFLGSEAQELGLVDELGGRQTAISEAENMTDLELNPVTVSDQQEFNLLSLFFSSLRINENSPLKAVL